MKEPESEPLSDRLLALWARESEEQARKKKGKKMGETAHNHQQPPPPQAAAAAPPPPSLALSRGPTWTPAEQLQQLQYCIHSNPSWR